MNFWANFWVGCGLYLILIVALLILGAVSALIVGMHLSVIRSSRLEEKKNGTLKF